MRQMAVVMLSGEVNVRSDYEDSSAMGVQNRKRKQVVSVSWTVPAPKRLLFSPMSDDDLDTYPEDDALSQSEICDHSQASQKEQCLHQGNIAVIQRRLSDSSVESKESLSADSGVEIDNTTSCRSPFTPVSDVKLMGRRSSCLKRTQPTCRLQTELAQDDGYVRRLASLNAQACVSALFASKPRVHCLQEIDCSLHSAKKFLLTAQKCVEERKSYCQHELLTDSYGNKLSDHAVEELQTIQENWTNVTSVHSCLHTSMGGPPSIIPIGMKNVLGILEHLKATPSASPLMKPRRGDNCWSCYGNPIKQLEYHHPKTNECIVRKYYIGIKRKLEEIFVRDCILVKGSSTKKPYIAKIASFWQEKGGLMMTLFWYYRPDDLQDAGIMSDFIEGELLASEHHDENTVACIEEKCYVIGLSQYCRFKAAKRREEDSLGLPGVSSILSKTVEDTSVNSHWLPSTDTDPSLVFLCHRGYNHLTGRLLKLSPGK